MRGSFALVLLDASRGVCLVARDGMGDGALSYVLRPDLLAVSVGILGGPAQLTDLPDVSDQLDSLRLAEFFAAGELSGPSTFFRDVKDLLPGEMLVVGERTVTRHWLPRPRLDMRIESASWDEAAEELARLLRTSVGRAIGGEERVAVWLSGGLDSTPLAAFAASNVTPQATRSSVRLVSWRVPEAEGDERRFVEAYARSQDETVQWVDCSDALAYADLATWPIHPSTPEQTPFRWFHERSYAAARDGGARLVLLGFGGDQLYLDARRWLWTLLCADGPGVAVDRLDGLARAKGWYQALRNEVLAPLLPKRRRLRTFLPAWLEPATQRMLRERQRWPEDLPSARRPQQAARVLSLRDAGGVRLESWFASRYGLEIAMPFRDFDLVQFLLAVPDHFLRQGTENRPILRRALRDLLPSEVLKRQGKGSFRATFLRGLDPARLQWIAPLLRTSDALWRGIVQPIAVERWLSGSMPDDWDRIGLMQCVNAELWRHIRQGGDLRSLEF